MNADSKELRDTAQPEEAHQVELKCCQRELKECRTRVEQMETLLAYVAELEKMLAESKRPEDQLRMMIDTIPTLAWACRPDGTTEFLQLPDCGKSR